MLKKVSYIFSLFLCFIFFITNTFAYDYANKDNESAIQGIITEIFDSKEMYEFLAGEEVEDEIITYSSGINSSYWWPIGSSETTEANGKLFATGTPQSLNITSPYGYRNDPSTGKKKLHKGIDISGTGDSGVVNIIAAKSGIVVYPKSSDKIDYGTDYSKGYGNYVVIKHDDGNYTLYGHLAPNTITVKEGDSVEQGQVIGKMGMSGYSTGVHLHFEVRVGKNDQTSAEDPLKYISKSEPRKSTIAGSSKLVEFINSWEGHTEISGDSYVVENIGDGVRTVGYGVTLENNKSLFAAKGINIKDYPVGSKIKISIVDDIKSTIIENNFSNIKTTLSKNGLTLKQNQIEALVSFKYQWGNINGFVSAYKEYGDTDQLYQNYFAPKVGTKFAAGLRRRRAAEWELFHNGVYKNNK